MFRTLLASALALTLVGTTANALTRAEIVERAREAFIWGYPSVDSYGVLYSYAFDRSSKEYKAPVNRIAHARNVASPNDRAIVAPNVDTPYSHAWLDLRAEPIVLTLPAFESERYVSLQLFDAYTYILGYVTPRTNGNSGGSFMVAGPDWKGTVPAGIKAVFRSPTNLVLAFYRTQILGSGDLVKVHALQDRYGVQTLSRFLGQKADRLAPEIKPVNPVDIRKSPTSMQIFEVLNWMLGFMPPLPEETALRERMAEIGIRPGARFRPDSDTETAIVEGMKLGLAEINARATRVKSSAELFGSREFLGQDYVVRAAGAMMGIYGNAAEEFLGVGYSGDSEGRTFDGRFRYEIKFAANELPPVGAFWSITVYTQDRFVYANSINRYKIGSMMVPELKRDKDGGFTIYLQHGKPGRTLAANWLPAPKGPLVLTFRTYLPGTEIRNGTWRAPPVVRQP